MYTVKVTMLLFIKVIYFLIISRALMSWFVRDLSNPIVRFLYEITEPMLAPIRQLLHTLGLGGRTFDFSPLVLFLLLNFLSRLIVGI